MSQSLKGIRPNLVDIKSITSLLSIPEGSHVINDASEVQSLLLNSQTKQVKELIRTNYWPVNHSVRQQLWEVLCNQLSSARHEALYKEMLQELFGEHHHPNSLPSFVDPAYCIRYHLNPEGRKSVEKVLHVIHHVRPDITYCPILYPLISLFLHYMPEDVTFSCISNLLSDKQFFVSQTKSAHLVSSYVVMKLTKKFARNAFIQLEKEIKEHENLEQIFQSWLSWIFKGLPFSYVVKLIDCFLLDKKKILYRIVLAVLLLYNKHSGKLESSPEEGIMERLLDFCQNMPYPVERLFKVAYGIRGFSEKLLIQQMTKAEMVAKSQSFSGERSMSAEGLPTSDSAYHLQMTSATSPIIRELRMDASNRCRSLGVIPLGRFKSEIVTADQMSMIWTWLPLQTTMLQPEVIYSTNEHGSCLTAFYMTVGSWEPTVIVMKTLNDEVFGAFCSSKWNTRNSMTDDGKKFLYFGTGETFLFTLVPEANKYPWVGLGDKDDVPHSAKLFMAADQHMITIGAGNGRGLWLDENLLAGRTEHCDTFNNEPLCTSNDFQCKVLEIIAFK